MEEKAVGVIVGSKVGDNDDTITGNDDGEDVGKLDGVVLGEVVGEKVQVDKVPKFLVFAELKQDA